MSNVTSSQAGNVGTPVPTALITRVGLSDYDVWRVGFDSFEERRNAAGIRNPRIYRDVNDGNQVVVVFDIADADKARQFFASGEVQQAMREGGGVLAPPLLSFV
jgi:hypothetical protein